MRPHWPVPDSERFADLGPDRLQDLLERLEAISILDRI